MNLKGDSSERRSCLAKQYFHEHNFVNFDLLLWVGFCNFLKSRLESAIAPPTSFLHSFFLCRGVKEKSAMNMHGI